MYLSAPFILQNFKQFLGTDPDLWGCPISGSKMAHLSWTKLFWYKPLLTFIYLLALLIVQNFKKFLKQIQSYEDVPFLGPKWSICPKQHFFWKIINIILIYLLAPFIVQNFKKILPADPELWGCAIFGSKMAHFPK